MDFLPFVGASSRSAVVAVLFGLLSVACDAGEPAFVEPLHPEDVRLYITQELAGSLTPDGRFILAEPPEEPYPQMTADMAGEIAVAFARTFGPMVRNYLETDHGRPIDFESLRVGSPAYYAATPLDPVPAHFSPGNRNAHGPFYLVYLVAPSGVPVLSVSVAAFSEAWIENGRLRFPTFHGADVHGVGVPIGQGFQMPFSPEQAARLVSQATGGRVTRAPEFVLATYPYSAWYSRWRIVLDQPVTVRGPSGEIRAVREIFVGLRGEMTIPAAIQPPHHRVADLMSNTSANLRRRPHLPMAFDTITFLR
jgi:hypothetical protein